MMASLHGLLLACIFFFSKKLSTKSNRFLGLALLGICVILGYECVYWLDSEDSVPLFIQFLPLYIRTTIPVGIFYFVIFLIQPEHSLSKLEKWGFVALGVEIFIALLYIPVNLLLENETTIENRNDLIANMGQFWGIVTSLILIPWALRKVNHYQKFLYDNYSTEGGKSLKWLRNFLLGILLIVGVWMVSYVQCLLELWSACESTFTIVTLCLVALLFWIGYFVILQYSWFEIAPLKVEENEREKEQSVGKLSSNTDVYHKNLRAIMEDEKLYEDTELTLDSLSERLQISSGYLSQIINKKEQKNFFEFVNSYRVEAVKKRLLDSDYQHYTIMGIALESGFKSKSTFNSVFKKLTGQTPSAYKRLNAQKKVSIP